MIVDPATDPRFSVREIFPGKSVAAPGLLRYSNLGDLDARLAAYYRDVIYADGPRWMNGVSLVTVPDGAVLCPGRDFLVCIEDGYLADQLHPRFKADPTQLPPLAPASDAALRIDEDCVMVARYGLGTWGHWLGELLPRVLVAERACPGRFRFVLPDYVAGGHHKAGSMSFAIQASLAAYGIGNDRLLHVPAARPIIFRRLQCVSSVWSPSGMMHDDVTHLMRAGVKVPGERFGPGRVALLRTETQGRNIVNLAEVQHQLQSLGFETCEVGRLAFTDQVRLFRDSATIASVLGSGLSGLIYAPEAPGIITLAPDIFGDRFFYGLMLDRRAHYADIRGSITRPHERVAHLGGFTVDLAALRRGVQAVLPASGAV